MNTYYMQVFCDYVLTHGTWTMSTAHDVALEAVIAEATKGNWHTSGGKFV